MRLLELKSVGEKTAKDPEFSSQLFVFVTLDCHFPFLCFILLQNERIGLEYSLKVFFGSKSL